MICYVQYQVIEFDDTSKYRVLIANEPLIAPVDHIKVLLDSRFRTTHPFYFTSCVFDEQAWKAAKVLEWPSMLKERVDLETQYLVLCDVSEELVAKSYGYSNNEWFKYCYQRFVPLPISSEQFDVLKLQVAMEDIV